MAFPDEGHSDERGRAEECLLPFRPGTDGPWDRAAAAHLVRRAAFGMGEAEVRAALSLGPRAAAEALLEAKAEPEDVRFTGETAVCLASLGVAQAAWIYRMLLGPNPAREKLCLFWHGHFATSNRKVDNVRLMLRQIDLFREKGCGPFPDFLLEVARDPAMLVWLDGNSNRRGQPNENFARELMELFSLGLGNYTENDIKEAARAFTGWHVRAEEFWFNERAHDREPKRVLGEAGPWGGEEVVRICASRDACAEFIASKLFEFYVHLAPGVGLRRELGRAYAACGKRTGEFLTSLFSSRVFYSRRARRALVSSPADFTVGTLRTLGTHLSAGVGGPQGVAGAMAAMGQELYLPPSVKGWEMGRAWLSSTTLLERYRFAQRLTGLGFKAGGLEATGLKAEVEWDHLAKEREAIPSRFFPEGLSDPVARALLAGPAGDGRSVVAGCLELPEYQFI